MQLASSWLIAGINEWLLSSESFQLCCGGRLFSCVLLGVAAHPSQYIKCRNYHLYSCHRSLFRCDLVEGSQDQELFIADAITHHYLSTWLSLSESLQLFFRGSGAARYMALVVRVTSASVQLCFGGCRSCASLAIRRVACSSVAGDAAIAHVSTVERAFWGESLRCML